MTATTNADQAAFWNSEAGQKWVDHQEIMDTVMGEVLAFLLARAAPQPGERVIDIGCGTGASTLALARAVEPEGSVTGVDISDVLLGRARQRLAEAGLPGAEVVLADAQTHGFAPGAADLMFSRFGVMFFEDPVAAFANIRRALRPGGRIAFISWSAIDHNPWFKVPRDAALGQLARLGRPAPPAPRAPGPLAFAEIHYVSDILDRAGYLDVVGTEEQGVAFSHPGGLDAVAPLAARIGPAVRIANELGATEADMAAISRAVLEGFADFATDDGIRVPARLNVFQAIAP